MQTWLHASFLLYKTFKFLCLDNGWPEEHPDYCIIQNKNGSFIVAGQICGLMRHFSSVDQKNVAPSLKLSIPGLEAAWKQL